MPRPAIARREEGAYGQYSTPVKNGLTPPALGCIDGQKWELILAWALSLPEYTIGDIVPAMSVSRRAIVVAIGAWLVATQVDLPGRVTVASAETTRIVAVADIHGAFDELVTILQDTELIDETRRWSGGAATLVQTGDFTDRGPAVRAVMDLLMALAPQAEAAGGRVVVLLGNHEVMNLMGNLRDVAPETYASFADEDSGARRQSAYQAHRLLQLVQAAGRDAPVSSERAWMGAHPPGYFVYREAMGPEGRYGRWLRTRPVAVKVGDTVFVHGGISPELGDLQIDDINARVWQELEAFDRLRSQLIAQQIITPSATFDEILDIGSAQLRLEGGAPAVLSLVLEMPEWLTLRPDGPVWFRGYATWPDGRDQELDVRRLLTRFQAKRFVVGHSVLTTRRVTSRFGGRVWLIDTGMLAEHYGGRPAALEIRGDTLRVFYAGGAVQVVATPR